MAKRKDFKHTEESKRKISENLKGKFTGIKHPMYGKHHSEETIKKKRTPFKNIVEITANVFGNFNFLIKNRIRGLPIKDKTPAMIMYIITD